MHKGAKIVRGGTDDLCTGKVGRKTTGKPRGERTELGIEEHNWKCTGNGFSMRALLFHVTDTIDKRLPS